jgi:hypothetical protein
VLSNSLNYDLRVSNYNRTCDCVQCNHLIEKGAKYFYVKHGKYKYAIHINCHELFLIWLKDKNYLNQR